MDDLGENLRKLRLNRKLSQENIADHLNISLSSYHRYESSKVVMDLTTIVKLAEFYKMSVDEIIHYNDPEFKTEEPRQLYIQRAKVSVLVELDGLDDTLERWIKKLTAINQVI